MLLLLICTFIGFVASFLIDIRKRDRESPGSPKLWSWEFFWKDNTIRYATSIGISLCITVFFALSGADGYLIARYGFTDMQWYPMLKCALAAAVGFTPDFFVAAIKRETGAMGPKKVRTKKAEYKRK